MATPSRKSQAAQAGKTTIWALDAVLLLQEDELGRGWVDLADPPLSYFVVSSSLQGPVHSGSEVVSNPVKPLCLSHAVCWTASLGTPSRKEGL